MLNFLTTFRTFDPKNNSLDFLRLILAILVIISHASGNYGREFMLIMHDFDGLETHLGTFAVYGFFGLSGYLITGSCLKTFAKNPNNVDRALDFFKKRILRIYPGFIVSMLVLCFIFVPLWLVLENKFSFDIFIKEYLVEIWKYIDANIFLRITKENIGNANYGQNINGPYWTLAHEFRLYIVTFVLGIMGFLSSKFKVFGFFLLTWIGYILVAFVPWIRDSLNWIIPDARTVILFAYYFAGSFLFTVKDYLKFNVLSGLGSILILFLGYKLDIFPFISPLVYVYLCLWLGIFLPFKNLSSKVGDYSYGVYIYSVPVMLTLIKLDLVKIGAIPFISLNIALSLIMGYLSWNLIEKKFLEHRKI